MVVFIISLLSSMLVGAVMVAGRKRGVVRAQALITRLDLAASQYENAFGDYPSGAGGVSSAEDLLACLSSRAWIARQEFDPDELADTDGNGRKEIIDHWGRPVSYYHHRSYVGPPRELSFRIISSGPDGVEGNADDVSNYKR